MNVTENRQDAFERAWADLDLRLQSGAANLRGMLQSHLYATDQQRLRDKIAGVEVARTLWADLSAGALTRTGDYAAMWRTFTDQMREHLTTDGAQPGYYQGIHLALTYQRGYGADIDAPVIPNPHVR